MFWAHFALESALIWGSFCVRIHPHLGLLLYWIRLGLDKIFKVVKMRQVLKSEMIQGKT